MRTEGRAAAAPVPACPPGVTLPELLVVTWLFGFVLAALAGFAGAQSRMVARTHDQIRAGDLVRTAHVVLGAELRTLAPADIAALTVDSIRIRAVRGSGVICGLDGGQVLVRYRGVRRPDPAKDSVLLVLEAATAGVAYALEAVAAVTAPTADGAACGGALRLSLAGGPPEVPAGVALVFETGAYSLAGALRYRRGAGGRQPLTEELLGGSAFQARPPSSLYARLPFRAGVFPRTDPEPAELSVHLANGWPQ